MIVDINASLGAYPFRRLRFNTPESLLGLMDRNGIDRAVVSWLPALFYRDAHRGNEELFAQTKMHWPRLIPVAIVNPKYVGWQRDLSQAVEDWKARIVTLTAEYHGYALSDENGRAALSRISDLGVPLLLTQRFEDRRQRHPWDRAEDLKVDAILEVARNYPRLRFILANWSVLPGDKLAEAGLKGRCLIDIARMQVVFRKEVGRLIEAMGVEAIAFGTHAPFDYVGPSLIKLDNLRILRPSQFIRIREQNALEFLALK